MIPQTRSSAEELPSSQPSAHNQHQGTSCQTRSPKAYLAGTGSWPAELHLQGHKGFWPRTSAS